MSAAFVQVASSPSGTATFSTNTTVGNCLVACMQAVGASSIGAVTTGSSADHWAAQKAVSGGGQVIAVWMSPASTVSRSSVTFTASGATEQNIFAFEFSGLGNAPTLAVTPASSLVTTVPNTTTWTSGTTASAAAGTVWVVMVAGNTSSTLGINSPGSPWHNPAPEIQRVSGLYAGMVADYQIPGSPGTVSYSPTVSTNTAPHSGIALAIAAGSTGGSSSSSAFLPFFR